MRSGSLTSSVLVIAAAAGWFLLGWHGREDRQDEMDYQGQRFKLTKAYTDYHDYKNDPDNLDPSENARVERAVTGAKVAREYANEEEMTSAVSEIQFPGYGLTSFSPTPQPDGSSLEGFAIEIPRAGKDRVLVFRGRHGRYTLIDDFVADSEPGVTQVRSQGGRLLYCGPDDRPVLSRPGPER